MLSLLNTLCCFTDDDFFGPVWIDNGTQLETLCGKNHVLGGGTKEEIIAFPECKVNQNSLNDQHDRCISMISGRDVQFTYTSCDVLHSALCESSEKLCPTKVTSHIDFDTTKLINTPTLKGDDQSSSTTNTTSGKYYFGN